MNFTSRSICAVVVSGLLTAISLRFCYFAFNGDNCVIVGRTVRHQEIFQHFVAALDAKAHTVPTTANGNTVWLIPAPAGADSKDFPDAGLM